MEKNQLTFWQSAAFGVLFAVLSMGGFLLGVIVWGLAAAVVSAPLIICFNYGYSFLTAFAVTILWVTILLAVVVAIFAWIAPDLENLDV